MDEIGFQGMLRAFKALADESRLRIIGVLAGRACSVEELASLLDLKAPTVSHHLSRLAELGLVRMRAEGTTHVYSFDMDAMRQLSKEYFTPERVASGVDDVGAAGPGRKVLDTFLDGERLTVIPASRKKRQVILRWLAERFEPNVRYPEAELNEILERHHWDAATLRRELLASRLMQREERVYWRVPEA